MGSSAKKKKEKKKDFQKTKLKVGKARPKNTNATDTSFTARSIVIKQQSLSEGTKDEAALFQHNLSLLSSKSETQRRDSLSFLSNYIGTHDALPVSASSVLSKVLPLILDGNSGVRTQVLKLVRLLPKRQLGPVDQALLYIRAGLTHLSVDIRLHTLDLLDWLLSVKGEDVVSSSGGWIKLLGTFQSLLNWTENIGVGRNGKWSSVKQPSTMGNSKLLVHQLTTLATLLSTGLKTRMPSGDARMTHDFTWHAEAHALPTRSNTYGYLSLFATNKDLENELYESAQERGESFRESGLMGAFQAGLENARKDGGETGRAAGSIAKAMAFISNND